MADEDVTPSNALPPSQPVYDRQTMQPVTGTPEELQAGIASGAYGFDASAPKILIKDENGDIYHAAPDKAAQYLATGKYQLPSNHELLAHDVEKTEEARGLGGSLVEGAKSGVNQLLLGVPSAITEETETPEERERRELVEQQHAVARGIGGAAGIGASLALGGEVFKGVELAGQAARGLVLPAEAAANASLLARTAATAADYAVQGGLLASPTAVVQAAFGDPQKAAETLAWGLGVGSLLGMPAELLGAGAKSAGEGLQGLVGSEAAQARELQIARNTGLKAAGFDKRAIGRMSTDEQNSLADFLHENELIQPGMSRQDIGKLVEDAHGKVGKMIGDTVSSLDEAIGLGSKTAKPEALDAAIKPGDIGNILKDKLDTAEMKMAMNADQRSALYKVIDSANELPKKTVDGKDVVAFSDVQKFASSLRRKWANSINRARNDGGVQGIETVTPLDQAKADAYDVVRTILHQAGDVVAPLSGQPELVGQLVKSKRAYAQLSSLEKAARILDAQQKSGAAFSLKDLLMAGHGPASSVTAGMGAAVGGALGGFAGASVGAHIGKVPGMALDFLARRWVEDRGLVNLSAAAWRAAKDGNQDALAAVIGVDAKERLARTMAGVGDVVHRMAMMGMRAATPRGNEHVKALLGIDTSGMSSAAQLDRLQNRLVDLSGDPAALANTTSALTGPIAGAAPQVADALQQRMAGAVQYLGAAVPRPPSPPAPFAPQQWSPTDGQKLSFHDKAEIVANPMKAMAHVEQGTLSDAHIDALKTQYPVVYGMMRDEVLKFATSHPTAKLPLAERASIAKFLGTPLDALDTPDTMRLLQQSYSGQAPTAPQHPKMSGSKFKDAPSHGTTFSASMGPAKPAEST
jgi:hypothetical protein